MEVIGQPDAPATLLLRKKPSVGNVQEDGLKPQPVWIIGRRTGKSLFDANNRTQIFPLTHFHPYCMRCSGGSVLRSCIRCATRRMTPAYGPLYKLSTNWSEAARRVAKKEKVLAFLSPPTAACNCQAYTATTSTKKWHMYYFTLIYSVHSDQTSLSNNQHMHISYTSQ